MLPRTNTLDAVILLSQTALTDNLSAQVSPTAVEQGRLFVVLTVALIASQPQPGDVATNQTKRKA